MRSHRTRPGAWALLAACATLTWAVEAVPAADPPPAKPVAEGQPAPDIDLPAVQAGKALPGQAEGKMLHLKDLQGKKNVVLYFFPKAATRG